MLVVVGFVGVEVDSGLIVAGVELDVFGGGETTGVEGVCAVVVVVVGFDCGVAGVGAGVVDVAVVGFTGVWFGVGVVVVAVVVVGLLGVEVVGVVVVVVVGLLGVEAAALVVVVGVAVVFGTESLSEKVPETVFPEI